MAVSTETIRVTFEGGVCWIRFDRPEAKNTITPELIAELTHALASCEGSASIVVLEGSPEVFCFGADFESVSSGARAHQAHDQNQVSDLYDLWLRMANGPYVVVSHVRGQANAGGVGFVAASDVVVADESAVFSLSELLFGLFPAMVLPFLSRKIGRQKAHYMTLMTKPVPVAQAAEWGLVDAYGKNSDNVLRRHLSRLTKIPAEAIHRYKRYMAELDTLVHDSRDAAIAANLEIFSDSANLARVSRFVEDGIYPWEALPND
ncbi:enoyl-CoA hydratase/isomerase [Actinobacteria bacterium YIM 96077]|uniref:Enoyl-CoA hydratase/isomerase n=1 Tax=Phytoactinopolyspora halophila TaxID=1981511 RepID=A0A329QE24_9ACTN|nr:enoyl-CoA hydratase/isomerase [Phytoactinopolyspora halophila]AYY14156.1 enoyl-CoA hydratase/isomerase [Actinobacteria bacterium YIM 96077]RAW10251.1 enoyl-CoA hydratase/isomerase [Phytoactinopolyspora halophila]